MENNYSLVIIDGSFVLTRAVYAVISGKDDVTKIKPGEIMRVNLQTINRLARDWGINGRKVIIIWDKWDDVSKGYIRSNILKQAQVSYKGSRIYISKEELDKIERTKSKEQYEKAKRKYDINLLKQVCKEAMINEFPKLGIQSYYFPGYEFDDIATLTSFEYSGKLDLPNIIVTKDTDLQFSLSPGCDFFKLPTYGSQPKIITYKEMYESIPKSLRDLGLSLYWYGAMMNSAGFFGHNDLKVTKRLGANSEETLKKIMSGDYSELKDPDLYKLQFSTYNIWEFPKVGDVISDVRKFWCMGKKGSIENFREVCKTYGITEISEDYYKSVISRFDERYFSL